MLPRIPQWYVVMLGLMKVGAVPMPATTLCTPGDIEYRVNEAEAVLAIMDMENSDKVAGTAGNFPTLEHLLLVVDERRRWVSYDEEMSQASAALDNVEPT